MYMYSGGSPDLYDQCMIMKVLVGLDQSPDSSLELELSPRKAKCSQMQLNARYVEKDVNAVGVLPCGYIIKEGLEGGELEPACSREWRVYWCCNYYRKG